MTGDDRDVSLLLLLAGVVAGLIFFVVPTIEVFRRPGFDMHRHAISMLSLGEAGWIMKAVFIVCGLLTMLAAVGVHSKMAAGTSGLLAPLLLGGFGAGLLLAGIFDAPAGLGFPKGTPDDQQPVMTTGATLHGIAFMLSFGSLIFSCFVFAFTFWRGGDAVWAAASFITGIALPSLIGLGVSMTLPPGIAFYWAAMLGWLWLGITLLRLR